MSNSVSEVKVYYTYGGTLNNYPPYPSPHSLSLGRPRSKSSTRITNTITSRSKKKLLPFFDTLKDKKLFRRPNSSDRVFREEK